MRPLVVVVAMAVCGAACADTSVPPVAHDRSPADSADQFIIGMQTVLNDAGLKRADILADTAYFFNDNARMEMRGVTANFFTSTGVNEGVLTAHRASYDTRTQIMEAWGNVVVTSMDGKRLTTSQLRFNNTSNLVHSDSAFRITEPDKTTEGIGFDSDPGLVNFKILHFLRGSAGTVSLPGK